MILELKHLAPYLPYRLRVMNRGENKVMNGATGWSNHWIGIIAVIRYSKDSYPILRPLSDLTKEIEHHLGKSSIAAYISCTKKEIDQYIFDARENHLDCEDLKWWQFERLLEHHVDVFGLIEAGLAIKKKDEIKG